MKGGEGDGCCLPYHVPARGCHCSDLRFQRLMGHKQRQSFPQHPAPCPTTSFVLLTAALPLRARRDCAGRGERAASPLSRAAPGTQGTSMATGPFPTSSIRSQQHRRDSRAHPSLTPHVLPTQHRLTLLETDRPFLLQNQDVKTQENDGPGPALFRAMSLFV